jgi:hypothetical protein
MTWIVLRMADGGQVELVAPGAGIVRTQADLDLAARHVREGEERLVRQEVLLTRLRAAGHPTALAESILANYSDVLDQMRSHLAKIEVGFAAQNSN